MTPQDETAMWRNRFILMNLVRIGATIVVLLAILLWQTDTFGTRSIIGFPIAIIALAVSFAGPRYLARKWRTPPEP